MLHAQAPAGGGVVRQGDVARAAHAVGRRAHRGVDGHGAVLHRRGPRPRPAPPADARPCRGPRGRTAPRRRPRGPRAARRPRAGSPRRRRRSGRRRRPPPATRGSAGPRALPSRSACGAGSGVSTVTPAPRIASDAAASQPTKPDPMTATRTPARDGGADRGRVVARADHVDAGEVRAVERRPHRLRSGAEHALAVRQRPAVLQVHLAVARAQGRDRGGRAQLDVVPPEPGVVLDRQLLRRDPPAQELLGERRPPVAAGAARRPG